MGVGVDAQTGLGAGMLGLKVAIDREAEADADLDGRPVRRRQRDDPTRPAAGREELNRQLGALRERVAAAGASERGSWTG